MILRCCCCGGSAPAKAQWWNRDHGYGICPRCFDNWAQKGGRDEAIQSCGHPGIHHSLTDEEQNINQVKER